MTTFDAAEILGKVQKILAQRGTTHGGADGRERNMAKCVEAFNAIYGTELTTEQGWAFMCFLKFSRMTSGKFNEDDYDDLIGYTALLAEEAKNENLSSKEPEILGNEVTFIAVDEAAEISDEEWNKVVEINTARLDSAMKRVATDQIINSISLSPYEARLQKAIDQHASTFTLMIIKEIFEQIKTLGGNPDEFILDIGCDDASCEGCSNISLKAKH